MSRMYPCSRSGTKILAEMLFPNHVVSATSRFCRHFIPVPVWEPIRAREFWAYNGLREPAAGAATGNDHITSRIHPIKTLDLAADRDIISIGLHLCKIHEASARLLCRDIEFPVGRREPGKLWYAFAEDPHGVRVELLERPPELNHGPLGRNNKRARVIGENNFDA